MTENEITTPAVRVPMCVSLYEAISWIAHKNLAGWSLGPALLRSVYNAEDDEDDAGLRSTFAFTLLLDHARRGLVRLYAVEYMEGDSDESDAPLRLYPLHEVQLALDFLSDPDLATDEFDVSAEWPEFRNLRTGECYSGIAVDYADLTKQFWGEAKKSDGGGAEPVPAALVRAEQEVASLRMTPTSRSQPLRPMSRRGRPRKHKWAEFTAEAVDYCLRVGPIHEQVGLVEYMKDWCAQYWQDEVSDSDVRAWIAPTFRKFEEHWRHAKAATAEKSEPDAAA